MSNRCNLFEKKERKELILPILIAPDKRLNSSCVEITELTDELDEFIEDLYDTMQAHDGIGISACQVGVLKRLCLVQIDDEDDLLVMINPKILFSKGETIDVEGCLSLPYLYGTVKRADEIIVEYYNPDGELMELKAQGYLARCIQHEIDHLNGILFSSKIEEKIAPENLERWMEEHEHDN